MFEVQVCSFVIVETVKQRSSTISIDFFMQNATYTNDMAPCSHEFYELNVKIVVCRYEMRQLHFLDNALVL